LFHLHDALLILCLLNDLILLIWRVNFRLKLEALIDLRLLVLLIIVFDSIETNHETLKKLLFNDIPCVHDKNLVVISICGNTIDLTESVERVSPHTA
jgi:hypothetical protein